MAGDHYSVLGVAKDAAPQDIKKAFRVIARECHPDVAGDDPEASERFIAAREAYETLIDPVKRARYDRRGTARQVPRGSFFDAFYNRHTGAADDKPRPKRRSYATHDMGGHGARKNDRDPRNNLDLDDLFADFGDFGFSGRSGPTSVPRSGDPGRGSPPKPEAGADVPIELEVQRHIGYAGGTVTAVYYRMQRADSWRPGVADPGVVRMQDIADVRILPGTPDGSVVRERGLGDAGVHGGAYGDLVVTIRLVGDERPPPKPERRPKPPPAKRKRSTTAKARGVRVDDETVRLDITLVEAMLGGRVTLDTPQGTVRISVPGGTSGGTRLRLRGKGVDKGDGPADLYVELRIVVPKRLDDESRALIERFAELNPGSPRDG